MATNWSGVFHKGDRVELGPYGQPQRYTIAYRDGGKVEIVTDHLVSITVGDTPFDVTFGDAPEGQGAPTRPPLTVIDGGKK